jgi:hypothetical protein
LRESYPALVDAIKEKSSSTPAQNSKKVKHTGKKTSASSGDYTEMYPNLGLAKQLGLDVLDTMHKAHKIRVDHPISEQKKEEELSPFVRMHIDKEEEFLSECSTCVTSNCSNLKITVFASRIDSQRP